MPASGVFDGVFLMAFFQAFFFYYIRLCLPQAFLMYTTFSEVFGKVVYIKNMFEND